MQTLLADSGEIPSAFDNLLTISGVSGGALVARYFETYDWDSAFLETDVTNRGACHKLGAGQPGTREGRAA